MRLLFCILIISVLLDSCNSGATRDKIELQIENSESQKNHPDASKQPIDTFSIYIDTLNQIEQKSLHFEAFKFYQFYDSENSHNLIYHETGKIKIEDRQYGLSIFSINDTTISVKLLKKHLSKWITCDSINLHDIHFSPVMFNPVYSDFNQNGVNDILLIFYQSMSVAYNYGYLVLFSKETEKLILLQNSIDIPNLEVLNKKIISITRNHPGHELKEYIKTDEYEISENQLMLVNSNKKYKK